MEKIIEFVVGLVFIYVVILICFTPFVLLGNYLDHKQCANNVTEMGREYRYDWINGCRIGLDDGTFIYWRMFNEVNK